jgi:hypothetical protein
MDRDRDYTIVLALAKLRLLHKLLGYPQIGCMETNFSLSQMPPLVYITVPHLAVAVST